MKWLALLACIILGANSSQIDYSGHQVFGVQVNTEQELKTLQDLQNEFLFYEDPVNTGVKHQVVVPPNKLGEFKTKIHGLDYQVDIEDLQNLIDLQKVSAHTENVEEEFWTKYQNYEALQNFLYEISSDYPNVTRVVEIGRSHENRSILAIEIFYRSNNRAVFIESNIHAREWITSATVTWIINQLLTSRDPAVRQLAESVNWFIIPVINPDGFDFTHTTNRLWRKSRTIDTATGCYGTDINRNFLYGFRENGGSSTNPCSETYSGSVPFSEVESQVLRDYLLPKMGLIDVYLAIHSYSQYILFPYSHDDTQIAETEAHLKFVANATAVALGRRHGTRYTFGSFASHLCK